MQGVDSRNLNHFRAFDGLKDMLGDDHCIGSRIQLPGIDAQPVRGADQLVIRLNLRAIRRNSTMMTQGSALTISPGRRWFTIMSGTWAKCV